MKNLTKQILEMINMQDEMNQIVSINKFQDQNWKNKNLPFYRASYVECNEIITDHIGYKWWKGENTDIDLKQIQIEVVDIWHFVLSDCIINNHFYTEEDLAEYFNQFFSTYQKDKADDFEINKELITDETEELILVLLQNKIRKDIGIDSIIIQFLKLANATNLSFEELYEMYVLKNSLNLLRQNYGYQDNTYIKMWLGEEDNVYLVRLFEEYKKMKTELSFYQYLEKFYTTEVKK